MTKTAAAPPVEQPPTITKNIRGVECEFPAEADDVPFEALEALEVGKLTQFIALLLPDEQMAELRALRPRLTVGDLKSAVDEVAVALGFKSAGE